MSRLAVYKTEGIILKAADWGDWDRLLTLYTRERGKIQARAISARKKESKLGGLLQNFVSGSFLLAESKTIDIVTDLTVADSSIYLRNNLKNLACAYYFAELTDKLIPEPENDINVWRLVSRVFAVLNQERGDLPEIQTAFEDKLLEFLGHPGPAELKNILPSARLNYLQSLAGEKINSRQFLTEMVF